MDLSARTRTELVVSESMENVKCIKGGAWRERYHGRECMANRTTREKHEAGERQGVHGMVARISPRNTKQEVEEGAELSSVNRRTLKFESESRVCAASLYRSPTVLLPQRTGQIEQPYDTRTIDLSCTEKGFCPLESGTSKPHGMSACAKHR